MPAWMLIGILIFFFLGTIVLFIAMFTELGTKRKNGSMKSTKTQHKKRKS
ncbi:MAG: hypothetical protein P1U42_04585 [Phycisphaerales bacterium]|nr:hypothetical protein [Phycisphaerales bacterium]